jgi:magnesium-transporting ATPase (P-type)
MLVKEIKVLIVMILLYLLLNFTIHGDLGIALSSSLYIGTILVFVTVIFRAVRGLKMKEKILRSALTVYLVILVLFFIVVVFNYMTLGTPFFSVEQLSLFGAFTATFFLILAFDKVVNLQKHKEFNFAFFIKYMLVVAIVFLILGFSVLILRSIVWRG